MGAEAAGQVHPANDTWIVALHASETDYEPLGCGIAIDARRILTCAHVASVSEEIWIAFPKAREGDSARRLKVERIALPEARAPVKDLALLHLSEPVPAGVSAAPLRCPKSTALVSRRWWAFGFPHRDPIGSSAAGEVGAALGYGWIQLDTKSRYPVEQGFSGAGLWSPDYQAVVAIVGQAGHDHGDGRAITLHQAAECFPSEEITTLAGWSAAESDDVALSAWGWTLAADREAPRHWRPRARGVSIDSERGFRFRGRTAALLAIRDWLDRAQPDRRVLVVTGAPGSGKSAVLGRVVTTSDRDTVAQLPNSDQAVRVTVGSVNCAVHAKGKTALEIATEIARAASAALPERIEDFASALRTALAQREGQETASPRRFNVIIDALDEAATSEQARIVIGTVILPMAETCADVGAQVIVGCRRTDDRGDLLEPFGRAAEPVDLDTSEFFAGEDLAAYALATLQLAGDERPWNPYAADAIAVPTATRIAELSDGNFLVAGLTARTHGLYDSAPVDPLGLSFAPRVEDAMREYLRRIPPGPGGVSAEALLTALAFAETPGLPASLWRTALRALGAGDVPESELARFARTSAASFLIESHGDDGQKATFRLFHQALNEALLRTRARVAACAEDERSLTGAFYRVGRDGEWNRVPAYLLRSLPAHAARANMIDKLLCDDAYLLHADLRRVLQVADGAASRAGRDRARLLSLSPDAVTASPGERASLFSVTEALDSLGTSYRSSRQQVPYRARWASTEPRRERATFRGHRGRVNSVCAVAAGGETLLASGSDDGTVRLWDPGTNLQDEVLAGHRGPVLAVCTMQAGDRTLIASGGADGTVRLWDVETGNQTRILRGHTDRILAVCAVEVRGRTLIASGSADRTVRLWDVETGKQTRILRGHERRVTALCVIRAGKRRLLASGSYDEDVRFWDLATGKPGKVLRGHQGWVNAVCATEIRGQYCLASGSVDGTVRLWDAVTGCCMQVLQGHSGGIWSVCAVEFNGHAALVTVGDDKSVRLWNLETGEQTEILWGHVGWVNAVCTIEIGMGRTLIASGGNDDMVRLWDPGAVNRKKDLRDHRKSVNALCVVPTAGRTRLAAASADGVRLWDPRAGTQERILESDSWKGVHALCTITRNGRTLMAGVGGRLDGSVELWDSETGREAGRMVPRKAWVSSLCAITAGNRALLACGGSGGEMFLLDPVAGKQLRTLGVHPSGVNAVCAARIGDREVLVSAGADATLRLWNPATGREIRALSGHKYWVNVVCAVEADDHGFLASGSNDDTVRLWDPGTCEQIRVLRGHRDRVTAVCGVTAGNLTLLASGSADATVRLWVPSTGQCLLTIPMHHPVFGMVQVGDLLAVGLYAGIIAIKLNEIALAQRIHA